MFKTYPNQINNNKNIKKYKRKITESDCNNFSNTDSNFFINSNNNSLDFNDENETNFSKKNKFHSINSSHKKITPIKRKLLLEKSKISQELSIKEKEKRNNDIWFKEIINKIENINLNNLQMIQNDFIKELNEIYAENLKKIEEVNKKYKNKIHEISLELDNVDIEKSEKYIQIVNEKNEILEEIEGIFIIKKNCSLLKYNDRMIRLKENIIKGINEEAVNIREKIIKKYCLNNSIKHKFSSSINFQGKKKKGLTYFL